YETVVFGTATTAGGAGKAIFGGGTGIPIWTPTFTSPATASVFGTEASADTANTVISKLRFAMDASYRSTVQRQGQAHPQYSRRNSVQRCRSGIVSHATVSSVRD